MSVSPIFRLVSPAVRQRACEAVMGAPEGYVCEIKEPARNLEQNARLHALIADIVKAGTIWAGEPRTMDDWKALFVTAYDAMKGVKSKPVPGLNGEFVVLRRSTARMGKRELSELIEMIQAWMAERQIPIRDGL